MKAAYVGTLTPGSTSRMRAEWLRKLEPHWTWSLVDTDAPIIGSDRIWQSAAYRLKIGPAVTELNAIVDTETRSGNFDLIWVDKAVFLRPETVEALRGRTRRLVHYTPDAAFHTGSSRHFEKTMALYDLLVTTKSFEVAEYEERLSRDTLHLTTQGYDARVHYPRIGDSDRRKEVAFVGLAEKAREECIEALLKMEVPVRLAGYGWDRLLDRNAANPYLRFESPALFGNEYATLLSNAWVGLGLLSKRFPELHTTRTFEIPACGAILATERTADTAKFFDDEEVIFFRSCEELAAHIADLFAQPWEKLSVLAARGRLRVQADRRDYESILRNVLDDPRLSV